MTGNEDDEHPVRARAVAEEYQRVLAGFANTAVVNGDEVGKVLEVTLKYATKQCRECPAEDAELDVSVAYEYSTGRRGTATEFDSADTIRAFAEMAAKLVPVIEANGWPNGYGRSDQ